MGQLVSLRRGNVRADGHHRADDVDARVLVLRRDGRVGLALFTIVVRKTRSIDDSSISPETVHVII
jgi:hypothetical protein